MSLKNIAISGVLAGALFAGACGGGYVAYRVPPPPPPPAGVAGYAPGPGYVWVSGFWDLRGGNWAWVGGRWARPPRPRAVWVADRWERQGGRWRYYRGHWG